MICAEIMCKIDTSGSQREAQAIITGNRIPKTGYLSNDNAATWFELFIRFLRLLDLSWDPFHLSFVYPPTSSQIQLRLPAPVASTLYHEPSIFPLLTSPPHAFPNTRYTPTETRI